MFSLRAIPVQKAITTTLTRCLSTSSPSRLLAIPTIKLPTTPLRQTPRIPRRLAQAPFTRTYASKSSADSLIETLQDQYFTARDEFEIASEETEKKSVYGAGDREAAREELDKLKSMFEDACKGENGEEIKKRIGNRIRELDNAVQALERSALEE
ncbi:hypothetical protein HYALB_00007995 [Hymenoscyphus albidus]|uniref:Uncharacterized protein n=1 Tax=Hymenoscyphus albidus TaxID=595503 RepID=A0A9N9LFD5_9HELO|nr:hypothetical protein HYALB_00007995 [Hymenoscyphus albidus]